jgi:7-cyano-7-deazaguanine synthase in queuosine biosynthesis
MDVDEVFTEKLMMHTERYFSQLGIPFVEKYAGTWNTKLAECYTVKLNIFGDIKGIFMLNIETSLAYSLVSHYILEAVNETEIPSYADKVIAEIANIVAGKTLSEEEDIHLYLGCPTVYLNSEVCLEVELELDAKPIRSARTEAGIIQCMFIKE